MTIVKNQIGFVILTLGLFLIFETMSIEFLPNKEVHAETVEARRSAPVLSGPGESNRLVTRVKACLLYTSPSPRDATLSRMPSSA